MACKVLVVCGSPVLASADLLRKLAGECDHVVAVDRGLDALLGAGLGCDVYVGDADTVSDGGRALVDAAKDFEVERHDPYKDYTDLALALDSVRSGERRVGKGCRSRSSPCHKKTGAAGFKRVGIYDPHGRMKRDDVRANCDIFIDSYEEVDLPRLLAFEG